MPDLKVRGNALVLAVSAAAPSFSIPGKDIAIFLNKDFTLCPALAEVSINIMLSSVAFAVASSSVTCLRNEAVHSSNQYKTEGERQKDSPLIRQVGLIPHQYDYYLIASF